MKQATPIRQSRAFWPMVGVFALVAVLWLAGGGATAPVTTTDLPPAGVDALVRHEDTNAAAGAVGRAIGENPLLTLAVLAVPAGALVVRSRRARS